VRPKAGSGDCRFLLYLRVIGGRNEIRVTAAKPAGRAGICQERTTLSATRRIRLFYLLYISKPQTNRLIYRAIDCSRTGTIVELGVGDVQRALRMIEVASHLGHPVRCPTSV